MAELDRLVAVILADPSVLKPGWCRLELVLGRAWTMAGLASTCQVQNYYLFVAYTCDFRHLT